MFGSLLKAVVGVVIETPLAIAKDVITLGGAITEQDEPYTVTALKKVSDNVSDATD
ncbi:MAG: hypothetical protein V4440_14720 [Pseudomonadota bacterium]